MKRTISFISAILIIIFSLGAYAETETITISPEEQEQKIRELMELVIQLNDKIDKLEELGKGEEAERVEEMLGNTNITNSTDIRANEELNKALKELLEESDDIEDISKLVRERDNGYRVLVITRDVINVTKTKEKGDKLRGEDYLDFVHDLEVDLGTYANLLTYKYASKIKDLAKSIKGDKLFKMTSFEIMRTLKKDTVYSSLLTEYRMEIDKVIELSNYYDTDRTSISTYNEAKVIEYTGAKLDRDWDVATIFLGAVILFLVGCAALACATA